MSVFFRNSKLSFKTVQTRLNGHLKSLQISSVQNGVSDTKRLYFTIFSPKHDSEYEFYISTDHWNWKDTSNKEIVVFKSELDEHSFHPITKEIETLIQNKLVLEKVELSKMSMKLKLYFSDGSVLEAQEDTKDEDGSYYQLMMFDSKLYQNYNLLIKDGTCVEEVTNGKEKSGEYKVALFDLDYFREEHRLYTNHAIKQARLKKAPVSFIQAKLLYELLTTKDHPLFTPWRLRRSTGVRTRLDAIPDKELIAITQDECAKNNFTAEEAVEILKSTIVPLKNWLNTEKNLEKMGQQEYAHQGIFNGLVAWYEEHI
jgi:hypothetical protein